MDKEQQRAAKARLVAQMQAGQSWQVAKASAGVQTSQSTAYRLLQGYRLLGETALLDGRHGHRSLLRGAARAFLEEQCGQAPQTPSSTIQALLFLEAVGLRRTWDLRGYTGQALALLTGRQIAYGYRHTERFLTELAQIGADEALTQALAGWTASLWKRETALNDNSPAVFYIDGHRKPVYADALIPRGLIGRTGKVLGCRALVLLHDQQGHPLCVSAHRGDQHLTVGLPSMIAQYEHAAGLQSLERIVVDREGMAAEFLAQLTREGRTLVTVLRTDQYTGVESFREVGSLSRCVWINREECFVR